MATYTDPKYDTDIATKGYVDRQTYTLDSNLNSLDYSKNFGIQPSPPYTVNDTYMGTDGIYICINERKIGNFNQADWAKASTYVNIEDAFRTGIITNGTLQGSNGGTNVAGITGVTAGNSAIRIWAGSTFANRNSAPFRVTQNGALTATGVNITGNINASNITGGTLHLQAAQTNYDIFRVTDSSNSNYYTTITGKTLAMFNTSALRTVFLTQVLNTTMLALSSADGSASAQFTSSGSSNTSDIRNKENITNIKEEESFNIISSIDPISFTYKNNTDYHRGVSAQQVIEVLEKNEIKNQIYSLNEETNRYMINYSEFIPDLINCIKYQSTQLTKLENRIQELEKGGK